MLSIKELSEKFNNLDISTKRLIVVSGFILLLFLMATGLFVPLLFILLILFGVMSSRYYKIKKAVQKDFKENHLQRFLQEIFPDATYFPDGSIIDVNGCRECNLFPVKKEWCETEDGLKMTFGKNNDISLEYVEVYTYVIKHDEDGDEYKETLFRGGLFKYTFFKKFKDNIYVIPNKTKNGKPVHGLLGGEKPEFDPSKAEKDLHEIQLEDVEFNELFSVFSANDEESFFILTPQYMSLMKDLYKKHDGKIRFKFSDNYMFIAISEMDLFDFDLEYNSNRQFDEEKTFEKCVNQTKEEIRGLEEFATTLELGDSIFY